METVGWDIIVTGITIFINLLLLMINITTLMINYNIHKDFIVVQSISSPIYIKEVYKENEEQKEKVGVNTFIFLGTNIANYSNRDLSFFDATIKINGEDLMLYLPENTSNIRCKLAEEIHFTLNGDNNLLSNGVLKARYTTKIGLVGLLSQPKTEEKKYKDFYTTLFKSDSPVIELEINFVAPTWQIYIPLWRRKNKIKLNKKFKYSFSINDLKDGYKIKNIEHTIIEELI